MIAPVGPRLAWPSQDLNPQNRTPQIPPGLPRPGYLPNRTWLEAALPPESRDRKFQQLTAIANRVLTDIGRLDPTLFQKVLATGQAYSPEPNETSPLPEKPQGIRIRSFPENPWAYTEAEMTYMANGPDMLATEYDETTQKDDTLSINDPHHSRYIEHQLGLV